MAMMLIGGCLPSAIPVTGDNERAWKKAFDFPSMGVLSSVWGSGPDDVFIVGGTFEQGEAYHFDGVTWHAMVLPDLPLLIWVFGFASDDVYAAGVGGTAVHFNGESWKLVNTDTESGLWGIWGAESNDIWFVGGNVGEGEAVILHYDGVDFRSYPMPPNDRSATALFKVWGIGSKVFAVGENGIILQFENGAWFQVPSGPLADDDLVSLWGTAEDNIIAVGGRRSGRIARYDGLSWTTERLGRTPGLNGVFLTDRAMAVISGTNGYLASYNPVTGVLERQSTSTTLCMHSVWADGEGTTYAVGGRFTQPFEGIAMIRTE